jgi:hypothetical protein
VANLEGGAAIGGQNKMKPRKKRDEGDHEGGERTPTGDTNPSDAQFLCACGCGHCRAFGIWDNGITMNIFIVVVTSIIFLASFPMFTFAFVVPDMWAPWLFAAGVLTACLAFAIPLLFLGRRR